MAIRNALPILALFLAYGCGESFEDANENEPTESISVEEANEKTSSGLSCASGCVWSGWAVALGAQSATHMCNGQPCACVAIGNIYQGCNVSGGQSQPQQPSSSWLGNGANSSSPAPSNNASVLAGTSCGSGCVWSSFAVQLGAQSGEANCGGQQCACVQFGNVWQSCGGASSPSHNQPAPQAQPSPRPQPSQPAPSVGPYGGHYNAAMGNRLADIAYRIAISRNTVGNCYNAAADAIESVVPRFLYGNSAYMAASQLAGHPRFAEISTGNLRGLPAGAVVVWGKGSSAHGHISIALGNGKEASDHIADQMTYHYGGAPARVFLPR